MLVHQRVIPPSSPNWSRTGAASCQLSPPTERPFFGSAGCVCVDSGANRRVRCSHMVALVHQCLLSQYLPCGSGSTLSFKSDARILFLQLYETHRDWIAERYQNVLRQFIEHESQSGTSHSNVTILVIAIASFRLWHFLPMSIFKHDLQSTTCH